jgi:hypothetical protein
MNKKEMMSKLATFLQRFGPAYAEWLEQHDAEVYKKGFADGGNARQKQILTDAGTKTYKLNKKVYEVVEIAPKDKK